MVGLHVLNNKIIGLFAAESRVEISEPLVLKVAVDRVHYSNLFVKDHIGVVRHTVGHVILTLKQVDLVVVNADIPDVFGD